MKSVNRSVALIGIVLAGAVASAAACGGGGASDSPDTTAEKAALETVSLDIEGMT